MRCWIIIGALAATPAHACPDAQDLASGIRVTMAEEGDEIYRDLGDGTVSQTIDFGGGEVAKNLLARGVYVKRLSFEVDGVLELRSVFETTYDRPPEAMSPPRAGLQDTWQTTVTSLDGATEEEQVHQWGDMTSLQIGDCTYDSIPGVVTYRGDETIKEEIQYLPALGLGLLVSYTFGADPPETMTPIRIEALE